MAVLFCRWAVSEEEEEDNKDISVESTMSQSDKGEIIDVNVKSESGEPVNFSDRNDNRSMAVDVTGDESTADTEGGMEMEDSDSTVIVKVDDLKVEDCLGAPGMVFKPWNDQEEKWDSEEEKTSSTKEEKLKFFSFYESKEDEFKVEEESEPEDHQDKTHSKVEMCGFITDTIDAEENIAKLKTEQNENVDNVSYEYAGQSPSLNCFRYSLKHEEVDKPCDASHRSTSQHEEVEDSSSVMDDQFSSFLCTNSKLKAKKSWIAEIMSIHRDLDFNMDARQASKLRFNDSVAHFELDHTEHSVQPGIEGESEVQTPKSIAKDEVVERGSCEKTYQNPGILDKHFVIQHSHKPTSNQAPYLSHVTSGITADTVRRIKRVTKPPVKFSFEETHVTMAERTRKSKNKLKVHERKIKDRERKKVERRKKKENAQLKS